MRVPTEIKKMVVREVASVFELEEFKKWSEVEDDFTEGHVAINNSLLFREGLKTNKNGKFLCIPVDVKGRLASDRACLASSIKLNKKFAYVSPKDKKAAFEKLDTVLSAELRSFGKIPFILIGTISDNVKIEAELGHKLFDRIILDPAQKELVTLNSETVSIRDAQDEEAVWNELEEIAAATKLLEPPLPLDLQQPSTKALMQLRSDSHAVVTLPDPQKKSAAKGLLNQIIDVLDRQIAEYSASLSRCGNDARSADDFNNVLRISYNFSSDATKILQLLISLSDLKPVLCWCTIAGWFALSEAFQKLPWSKSTTKPSLSAYQSIIGGARNKSFHNLFPFSKTLRVPLGGVPLEAIRLTFFSEYGGKKNSNRFEYQDQDLIEAFTEFTRAGEKFVPFSFWGKNLDVMSRTVDLLRATGDALRCLSNAT